MLPSARGTFRGVPGMLRGLFLTQKIGSLVYPRVPGMLRGASGTFRDARGAFRRRFLTQKNGRNVYGSCSGAESAPERRVRQPEAPLPPLLLGVHAQQQHAD